MLRSRRPWRLQVNRTCPPVYPTLGALAWSNRLTCPIHEPPCGAINQRNVSTDPGPVVVPKSSITGLCLPFAVMALWGDSWGKILDFMEFNLRRWFCCITACQNRCRRPYKVTFFPLVVKHRIDFPLTCCHLCKRGFNLISDMLISPPMKPSCATEHRVHACM